MGTGIYLVGDDRKLVEMVEQPYAKEDLLQELLADHPSLLAGGQIDSAAPRRWLLVSREVGVPDGTEASDRWAVDQVFLD